MTALLPLSDADDRCGRKAATLGVLLRQRFTVPPGFVVTDPHNELWTLRLAKALARLGPGPYAVRSSALADDVPHASFAGQLHTTLNVASATAVIGAVAQTAASGSAAAPTAYTSRLDRPAADMVPAWCRRWSPRIAGVMFTRHPVTGADECVIEATHGLGDNLMNGDIAPERWTIDESTITLAHRVSRIGAAVGPSRSEQIPQ